MKKITRLLTALSVVSISACQTFNSIPNSTTNTKNINDSTYDFDFSTKSECYGYGCPPEVEPNPKPSPISTPFPIKCEKRRAIDLYTVETTSLSGILYIDSGSTSKYSDAISAKVDIVSEKKNDVVFNSISITGKTYLGGNFSYKSSVGQDGFGKNGLDGNSGVVIEYFNRDGSYKKMSSGRLGIEGKNLVLKIGTGYGSTIEGQLISPITYSTVKDDSLEAKMLYKSCLCNDKYSAVNYLKQKIEYENKLIIYNSIKISQERSKEIPNEAQIESLQEEIDQSFKNIIGFNEQFLLKEEDYNEECVDCSQKRYQVTTKIDNTENYLDSLSDISTALTYIDSILGDTNKSSNDEGQIGTFSTKSVNPNLPVNVSQGEYNRALALKQAFYEVEFLQNSKDEAERLEYKKISEEEMKKVIDKILASGKPGPSRVIPVLKVANSMSAKAFAYVVNHPKFITWMEELKNLRLDRTGLQSCPFAVNPQEVNSIRSELNVFKDKIQSIVKSFGKSSSRASLVLKDFTTKPFNFGKSVFTLEKKDMDHILTRHHPNYWDGSLPKNGGIQTFFEKNTSLDEIYNAIESIMNQNSKTLIAKGTRKEYIIVGLFEGKSYEIAIRGGRVGSFYPLP